MSPPYCPQASSSSQFWSTLVNATCLNRSKCLKLYYGRGTIIFQRIIAKSGKSTVTFQIIVTHGAGESSSPFVSTLEINSLTLKGFQLVLAVTKSFILNAVRVLDLPLEICLVFHKK